MKTTIKKLFANNLIVREVDSEENTSWYNPASGVLLTTGNGERIDWIDSTNAQHVLGDKFGDENLLCGFEEEIEVRVYKEEVNPVPYADLKDAFLSLLEATGNEWDGMLAIAEKLEKGS